MQPDEHNRGRAIRRPPSARKPRSRQDQEGAYVSCFVSTTQSAQPLLLKWCQQEMHEAAPLWDEVEEGPRSMPTLCSCCLMPLPATARRIPSGASSPWPFTWLRGDSCTWTPLCPQSQMFRHGPTLSRQSSCHHFRLPAAPCWNHAYALAAVAEGPQEASQCCQGEVETNRTRTPGWAVRVLHPLFR